MTARRTRPGLFPCFLTVDSVPPLVIGNAAVLEAKIRLLLKFAPIVDLVTDMRPVSRLGGDRAVRVLADVSCRQAHDHIAGRPLVILDTADPALNASLSAVARAAGVPVNVPDNTALSSAWLGSIVDRAPVLIAISTAGAAPVLGQRVRARIESMLPAGFGRIATYLSRRRDELQGLVPARRRAIQHRIIDGPAAAQIISGDESAADRQLAGLIAADRARAAGQMKAGQMNARQMKAGQMNAGQIKIVDIGSGDVGLLSLRGVEAIRNADLVVHQTGTDAAIIDLARREADFAALPDGLSGRAMRGPVKKVADMVVAALLGGQFVVLLLPPSSPLMMMLVDRLAAGGQNAAIIPAARPLDDAGTGWSGTGRSGTGRSGTGRSGTGRSGTGRSGIGRSGIGRPGTGAMIPPVAQPAIRPAIQSAGRHGRAWHAGDRP
jgi:uroporphyrin-III C-methyltransferase/precorrin-2 dehydrogenase/sirohydrochlorin ferrochelatase